ncbi:MAG: hypothetical protein RR420_01295, partial [Anaerovoracaceae bacterium]
PKDCKLFYIGRDAKPEYDNKYSVTISEYFAPSEDLRKRRISGAITEEQFLAEFYNEQCKMMSNEEYYCVVREIATVLNNGQNIALISSEEDCGLGYKDRLKCMMAEVSVAEAIIINNLKK